MHTDNYFKNIEKYWSANFLAYTSFFSILFVIYAFIRHNLLYDPSTSFDFTSPAILLHIYFSSVEIAGFEILFMLFPLSIPLFYLLKTVKKNIMLISFIVLLLTFFIIVFFIGDFYKVITEFGAMVGLGGIYVHTYKIFLPIFIALPILCKIDSRKKYLVTNTLLVNNKFYKAFIRFFFCYFWLIYILFFLGLIVCIYMDINLHYHK